MPLAEAAQCFPPHMEYSFSSSLPMHNLVFLHGPYQLPASHEYSLIPSGGINYAFSRSQNNIPLLPQILSSVNQFSLLLISYKFFERKVAFYIYASFVLPIIIAGICSRNPIIFLNGFLVDKIFYKLGFVYSEIIGSDKWLINLGVT